MLIRQRFNVHLIIMNIIEWLIVALSSRQNYISFKYSDNKIVKRI